jgi:hypothetical protein
MIKALRSAGNLPGGSTEIRVGVERMRIKLLD